MNMKVQALAIMLLATAHGGAYATTGVTTSGTEITVCVEAGETLAMPPIGASVTKVVKTGGGEAQFTPADVTNTFTAALEIQAGTLSGHRASFGKSSLITVVPGATLKLTGWDASAQWTQDTTSTIGAGKARIGGSGVGGAGALVRTFRYYPDGTLCLFTDLTLTDDTLMDTGGGLVGFLRDGMFDMGTHALTLTGASRLCWMAVPREPITPTTIGIRSRTVSMLRAMPFWTLPTAMVPMSTMTVSPVLSTLVLGNVSS